MLLPAAARQDEVLSRVELVLQDLQLGRAELELHDQMICIRLGSTALDRLLDQDRQAQFVQHLENLGFRYMAIDLSPLA